MKKILLVFAIAFTLLAGTVSAEEPTTIDGKITIMADPGGQPIVP